MSDHSMLSLSDRSFRNNPGWRRTFAPGTMTLGVALPLGSGQGSATDLTEQVELVRQADAAGFAALWLRDVPLRVPSFGDLGQVLDPWTYLGLLCGATSRIALGTAAIVLPLAHPLILAKQAASVDHLSGGRLMLGVASGDRPEEFPAFGLDVGKRGEVFREHFGVLKKAWTTDKRGIKWSRGRMWSADVVPKPLADEVPTLVVGSAQQSMEWRAENGHGWMTYTAPIEQQRGVIAQWNAACERHGSGEFQPFAQSMGLDLAEDPNKKPEGLHLGMRLGRNYLLELLGTLRDMGVHHLSFGLRLGDRPASEVLAELGEYVLPEFPANE
ncbi:LLM class oxidoreductase [Corynebacterium urogenitale]